MNNKTVKCTADCSNINCLFSLSFVEEDKEVADECVYVAWNCQSYSINSKLSTCLISWIKVKKYPGVDFNLRQGSNSLGETRPDARHIKWRNSPRVAVTDTWRRVSQRSQAPGSGARLKWKQRVFAAVFARMNYPWVCLCGFYTSKWP